MRRWKADIRQAVLSDLDLVEKISKTTISEMYPRYYPQGAVGFFLEHHSKTNIAEDIKQKQVFLCIDLKERIAGTITIKENEICRLFVLPEFQGKGYGTQMLDFAENMIFQKYRRCELAASFPAKSLYLKRGYKEAEYHTLLTENQDYLCYDIMVKEG
mgnify:CR=1 FL=1